MLFDILYSDVFILVAVPAIILALILWICKSYNFSIIPSDLKKKKKSKKKNEYTWDHKIRT
jgi:hypothetical protein